MVELFAGRYAFVDLLGSGGMGTVWRVWDARRQQYAGAKVLSRADSVSLLRFIRETSWRVHHEHVLTPTGWAAEDDRVLFTMPLVRGGTVADLVRDFGALPEPWVAEVAGQLLEALAAVHATGLVHRDVKPSNLLLDPTGAARPNLRLSDFGIASHVTDPRLTRAGEAVGTVGYVAPEVLAGAEPDPRQDLYAVGVVLLELLTGQRPPAGAPRVPPEVGGRPIGDLVAALVDADPQQRPDAAAAAARLRPLRRHAWDAGDVEVFEHVPALPAGWTDSGPAEGARSDSLPARRPEPDARLRAGSDISTAVLGDEGEATRRMPAAEAEATRTERWDGSAAAPAASRPVAPAPPASEPRVARPDHWLPVAVVLLIAGGASVAAAIALLAPR